MELNEPAINERRSSYSCFDITSINIKTLADHACDEQVSMGGGVTSFVEDEQVGQVVPGQLFRFG